MLRLRSCSILMKFFPFFVQNFVILYSFQVYHFRYILSILSHSPLPLIDFFLAKKYNCFITFPRVFSMFKKLLDKTFWRFILVGCLNTLFGAAIMFLFYNCLHLSYWLSSASNYFFGSILSYFLNKYFTFNCKKRSLKVVFRFVINITLCYLLAYGLAKPLVRLLLTGFNPGVQDNLAMLTGMVLFTLLNYFGQRFFAFNEQI